MILDTEIAIGKIRTDSIGALKFPNFKLLLDLANRSFLDQDVAETLLSVDDETVFRVGPESENSVVFSIEIDTKWQPVAQINQPFSDYMDSDHKQIQGRGWNRWRNGDFMQPFTPDLILSHLGWARLIRYLKDTGVSVTALSANDELTICNHE